MTTKQTAADALLDHYRATAEGLTGLVPGTDGLRSAALARFADTGVPGSKVEAFRYADLKGLRNTGFVLAPKENPSEDTIPPMLPGVHLRFVFVNGAFSEELSGASENADTLLSQVRSQRLGNHLSTNPERATELEAGQDGLALLNTALMQDGFVLQIPSGVEAAGAIELLHVMTKADGGASHPRVLVELGEKASFTLIERAIGDDTPHWYNPVTQVRLSEGSVLNHIRLFEEGANATVTSRTHVRAGAGTSYYGLNGLFAGKMVRVETYVKVLGEDGDHSVDGVSLAATGTVHDSLTHLDHQVPESDSVQIFRAVTAARGTSSFQGKVTVAKDAQHTEANQSFKALVLDRTGEANVKPELEILADDVQCAHGATIGELDQNALFYLTSRGVDPKTARGILIRSFLGDALVRFEGTPVADIFEQRLDAWFDAKLGDDSADA